MNRVEILDWIIELDTENTIAFYKTLPTLSQECGCIDCKNFVEATKQFPKAMIDVFNKLGIDPTKNGNLTSLGSYKNGTHKYGGSYHLVGKIVEGKCCTSLDWNDTNTTQVENFTVGFSDELMFVPNGFPTPIIQLEFVAIIPWVLNEKPDE